MSRTSIRADVMSDLLEEFNVKLDRQQLEQLVGDFADHLDMEREIDSYQFIGTSPCKECIEKQKRINKLEAEASVLDREVVKLSKMPYDSYVSIIHGLVFVDEPMR